MSPALIIGLVVLGIITIVLLVAFTSKLVLHLMKRPLEARIAAEYEEHEVLLKELAANSIGLESAGVFQLRGNGALVLTRKDLHFFQFLPKKEVRIPLDSISELAFTRSHLGKVTGYELLKVRFSVGGKADSIAWYVPDPHGWKERIEEVMASRTPN